MILQICAAAAASAFVAVAVIVLLFTHKALRLLEKADRTLSDTRRSVSVLTAEAVQTLQSVRRLSKEAQSKLEPLSPMMNAVRRSGEAAEEMALAAKELAGTFHRAAAHASEQLERRQESVSGAVEWAASGIRLWRQRQAPNMRDDGSR